MPQALVVVSADGQYGVSSDQGATWVVATMPSAVVNAPTCIAYGNGVWVALSSVTQSSIAAVNISGEWVAVTLPVAASWRSVVFFSGQFYAFANSTAQYLRSSDGVNWSALTAPSAINRVVSSGAALCGYAYSFGSPTTVIRSVDGVTWTSNTPALGNVADIFWNGSLFVLVGGNDQSASSADGLSWSIATVDAAGASWHRGGGDAARSLMVEQNTSAIVASPSGALAWTASNLNASLVPEFEPPTWNRVSAIGGRILLSADHGIVYADDGLSWQLAQASTGGNLPSGGWAEIASGELTVPVPLLNSPLNINDTLQGTALINAASLDALNLSTVLTLELRVAADYFDSLMLSDLLTSHQALTADLLSTLSLSDNLGIVLVVDGGRVVLGQPIQYGVNAASGAVSRYQGFGFDAYARCGQTLYGVREDGVYQIRPGSDNGAPINVQIDFGKTDFGAAQTKLIEAVYLGVATDGEVYVRLRAGDADHTYRAIQHDEMMRAKPGKGAGGRQWSISLEVTDASNLTLDMIEFRLGASARRLRARN